MTRKHPTHEETAARAYQIYVERGRLNGHDLDDWLQAEYELLQLPVRELAKLPTPKASPPKSKPLRVVELVRQTML